MGVPFGYMVSAAHGTPAILPDAPLTMPCPVSFTVDAMSMGLPPPASPVNGVFLDFMTPEQQVTVYQSSAAGALPDMTNSAVPRLAGAVGPPPDFAPSDEITSISFGMDGTGGEPATLYFSVGRASLGVTCTDVWWNSAAHPPPCPGEAAGDVYASGSDPFGAYDGVSTFGAPREDNILAADSTALGLRPLLVPGLDMTDNVTGLELTVFDNSPPVTNLLYATFAGPTFPAGSGLAATIFVYDPATGPFAPAALLTFSAPADAGLLPGDVIDALVLSDVDSLVGTVPPSPDGILDPDQDEALFSLAPGSPSLVAFSAADVLYTDFDGTFTLWADAGELGLLPADDVDALDIKPTGGSPCPPGGAATQGHQSCFEPHGSPGCDDAQCEAAVCHHLPLCCVSVWDNSCVQQAQVTGDCQPCSEPHGLPGCQDAACAQLVCAQEPSCCQDKWDATCVSAAAVLCTTSCQQQHPTPGCDNPSCCEAVCALAPSCCAESWSEACVQLAAQICFGTQCSLDCPVDASLEPELCGEDLNGGCNAAGVPSTPLPCGAVCGRAWADAGERDTDWYLVCVPDADGDGESQISLSLAAEFPAVAVVLGGTCPRDAILAAAESFACGGVTATVTVPAPADYLVAVAPGILDPNGSPRGFFEGIPCVPGAGNRYVLSVGCGCPWDFTGPAGPADGLVGINDFLALLANWGPCPPGPCPWDTNGPNDAPDGMVGINDFLDLLRHWGRCPVCS